MGGRVPSLLIFLLLTHAFEIPVTMTEEERLAFLTSQSENLKGAYFVNDPDLGHSIGLTKSVKKGECVVSMSPNSAITGVEEYELTPFLGSFSAVERIAIRVTYERLLPRDPTNYKREYAHSLPANEFHQPMFWADEDFELFESHTIDQYSRQFLRAHDVDSIHKRIVEALEDVPNLPPGMLTREATIFGLSVAISRAFSSGGDVMKQAFKNSHIPEDYQMLLPLMDIVNHMPVPPSARLPPITIFQVFWQLDTWICYRAQFDQKPGRHFMGTYGQKPNYKLVSMYSFALETNADDELTFSLPMTEYCTGGNNNGLCTYTTPAYLLNGPALKYLIRSTTGMVIRGDLNFEALVKMIDVASQEGGHRNKMIFALRTYRSILLDQMNKTPLRSLRRLRGLCDTFRCRMIYTFCAAQRVSRLLHTEMVDRRLMKLLSAGLF